MHRDQVNSPFHVLNSSGRLNGDCSSLAWCELYLILATLFRRFEITIHDTTDSDMEWMDFAFMLYVSLVNLNIVLLRYLC
jgi:hypothetical protein